jgi:threonine dehydratase
VKARIFVPEIAAPVKIAKIKAYGAEVVVEGATYFDAQALCDAYVAKSGALAIHPYAAPQTIAGQGTVALEWEEDLARAAGAPLDAVLVAIQSVAADSLGARSVGALNLAIAERAVDHVALVADEAIRAAQLDLWRDFSIVAEPGGAAAYAALASGAYRPEAGERVGVLMCGANANLADLSAAAAL